MEERNVSIDRENGGSLATFSLVAVIVVVALIALFVWQPWNSTSTSRTSGASTTITQPGGAGSPGRTRAVGLDDDDHHHFGRNALTWNAATTRSRRSKAIRTTRWTKRKSA